MISNLSHVMTLANSIIGVSVLAMPFCFKQCGIVLAMLVLLVSSVLSRLACHFLIKSAVMSRRRNFEFLAFHAFGRTGKFLVELFIIGFLVGTCIAFFVVVGDLGPQIVGKMLNKRPEDIRTSLLVTTGTFIVFPLGLLRNIDSLSSVCTATIGFYLCLVVKVIAESARHIFLGDWYDRVMYWRPAGILQCLPIFAMALFCQTQLFEIYEAIPNVCLEKMNRVVRGALNICTIVYLCVGFFGYVAFCTQPFTGNILMSFEPSLTSDLIKMGFVFSVAFSFPLVIFPCRASLNSLLFRRAHTHEPSNYYIPEMRFRCLTLTIVALSLGTGILIPNIEFVLGIVGSTIGVMICLIFPAAFFIAISTKNTNERLIAQAILFFGMWIMVLGTYANLYAMEESSSARLFVTTDKPLYRINDVITLNGIPREGFLPIRQLPKDVQINQEPNEGNLEMPQQQLHKDSKDNNEAIDVRREPPIPVERSIMTEKSPIETRNLGSNLVEASTAKILESNAKTKNGQADVAAAKIPKPQEAENAVVGVEKRDENKRLVDERKENLIDSDAIKKEESELAAAGNLADVESAAKFEKLQQTLEKHKLEQMKMMQEQKEILKDIKEQKQELQMEKKRLAEEQRKKNIDAREERINKVETIIEEKPSIVRSNHGNNHQVNDVDHRSIESLNEKDQMPDKSSNQRNNHGNDLQLDKVDNRLIETQNVVDKSLEKSSNIRNNHQVDQEDRLSVDGQKENDKPPEKSSVNEENVQRSVINQQEIPNSNNLESPLVESDKSRGPILNALTNWTSKRNSSIKEENRDAKIVEPLPKKREFALPIALQLRNQTKESPEKKLINASNADSETLAIQRDILDRADRLKREATENSNEVIPNVPEIPETVPEEREKSVDIQRDKNDREQCRQKEEKSANFISRDETSVKTKQETSSVSPSTITIKSLVYLAEQQFTDEILAPDPNNVKIGEADLTKLKKRDLKSFNSE